MEESNKFTTPKGKVVEAYIKHNTALWGVRFTSGGELPKELTGLYTHKYLAERKITDYLDKRNA